MISNYNKGIFLVVVACVIWGAAGPIARMISEGGVSQTTAMAFRSGGTALLVALWMIFRHGTRALAIAPREIPEYVLLGFLAIVLNATGLMISCVYMTVPQAMILHYTFPLLTVAGDCFITRERPTPFQWAAGALVIIGMYVGFIMGDGLGSVSAVGAIWGGLSTLGSAAHFLLSRSMTRRGASDPLVQLGYANFFGCIFLIVGISATVGWGDLANITPRIGGLIAYQAIMISGIAYALVYISMRWIPAGLAGLLSSLEIVAAMAMMPIINAEWPSLRECVGALIVVAAVSISTIRPKKYLSSGAAR